MKKLPIALVVVIILSCTALAQDAKAIYASKCAMCHAPDGKGQTAIGKNLKVRDLSSPEVQKQTDAELAAVIGKGKAKMPAFTGKLNDGEIAGVVKFIRTLK